VARISKKQPYLNHDARGGFDVIAVRAIEQIRLDMDTLRNSRSAGQAAPGAIHALRKICEGEDFDMGIHREEVEEWREDVRAWLRRVNRWIPAAVRKSYAANIEADFKIILKAAIAQKTPFFQPAMRTITVPVLNAETLAAAVHAANEKNPLQLRKYLPLREEASLIDHLQNCITQLIES